MRQLLAPFILLIIITFTVSANSQITVTVDILPQIGDTLNIASQINAQLEFGGEGGPLQWDFTSLNSNNVTQTIYREPSEGSVSLSGAEMAVISPLSEAYYSTTVNSITEIALYGQDITGLLPGNTLVTYDPGRLVYDLPMAYPQENSSEPTIFVPAFGADQLPEGVLDGLNLPFPPDSLRASIVLNTTSSVNAYGTLSLSSGTFEVIQEVRETLPETQIGVKIGIFPWADIPAPDNIPTIPATKIYYYWNNEYSEPIAAVYTDPETNEIQQVEFIAPESVETTNQNIALENNSLQISAFPNPASTELNLSWDNDNKSFDSINHISCIDLLGNTILTKIIIETNSANLDISTLPVGTYFVCIHSIENQIVAKKLFVKK